MEQRFVANLIMPSKLLVSKSWICFAWNYSTRHRQDGDIYSCHTAAGAALAIHGKRTSNEDINPPHGLGCFDKECELCRHVRYLVQTEVSHCIPICSLEKSFLTSRQPAWPLQGLPVLIMMSSASMMLRARFALTSRKLPPVPSPRSRREACTFSRAALS
mmetsp:Transcript_14008/g.33423  ORF Transcript_14008/g.33423 Transcript_14008/m.33423 type:complete len:160 (-) Transcript_14008:1200-1679(-)